jgi:outer membrane protein OmpA-like peptidoglycan-associated protein
MKKQLLLIGLIFTMFVVYSQTIDTKSESKPTATADTVAEPKNDFCPHRLWLHFGGGYASNTFKEIKDISKRTSYFAMAEFGYTYFFHRNVGIGIGVGIHHTGAIAKINDHAIYYNLIDPGYNNGDPYDLTYNVKNIKEKQNIWAIEVPLVLQFEKKWGKHGIYAGIGVKGYFPFSARVGFTDGTIESELIWDEALQVHMKRLLKHMDPKNFKSQSVKPKMRCSVDILADFGGIFGISRSTDIYIGAYGSYGFLNILPKNGIDLTKLDATDPLVGAVTNKYVNTTDKWNLWQVGAKIGFHFLPCKSCGNEEYMGDMKRKYMNEMMKKKNEPVVVTNTVQEYYYFVPTVSQELLEENANNPEKKKAIAELAAELSKIKILFDLDKDIPKLDDYKKDHIRRASELLRANTDLKVIITGYTSPEGTKDHNRELGHRRALAVRKVFIDKHGVSPDQIAVQNFIAEDQQHKVDIPEKEWSEQRAVIFRIEKK